MHPCYDKYVEGCVEHDARITTTTTRSYLSPNPLRDDGRFSDPPLFTNPNPLPEP